MITFQIGLAIPLALGPCHLSAVRTVRSPGSSSWSACYLMVTFRSSGMLVKPVKRPSSCQRPLGSHWQPLPPMNSDTGPDHAVHIEEEKRLEDSQIVNDLLSMIMNFFKKFLHLIFNRSIFPLSGKGAALGHF